MTAPTFIKEYTSLLDYITRTHLLKFKNKEEIPEYLNFLCDCDEKARIEWCTTDIQNAIFLVTNNSLLAIKIKIYSKNNLQELGLFK